MYKRKREPPSLEEVAHNIMTPRIEVKYLQELRSSPLNLSDLRVPTPDELRKPRMRPSGANAFQTLCRILRTDDFEEGDAENCSQQPLDDLSTQVAKMRREHFLTFPAYPSPKPKSKEEPKSRDDSKLPPLQPLDSSLSILSPFRPDNISPIYRGLELQTPKQSKSTILQPTKFRSSPPEGFPVLCRLDSPPSCLQAWRQLGGRIRSLLLNGSSLFPQDISTAKVMDTVIEIKDKSSMNRSVTWGWVEESFRALVESLVVHIEASRFKERELQETIVRLQKQNAKLKSKNEKLTLQMEQLRIPLNGIRSSKDRSRWGSSKVGKQPDPDVMVDQ
eukprot:Gregarina_sp_Poly_1__6235@NODE_3304_length_1197_cov_123_046903_g2097_i0_p1_GENE_NODE_3304_length_1197_cov_123_046903_g2097_i0NODE_3304_length_1197_cov_123_046903_g2097_i0_p1_ORF_typecomplete_len333_score51_02ZapB/PF06005_12/0_00082Rootletin/PF15035_6/0_0051HOOK/PF05622_12/0_016DivIC/PF04977_15/0_019HMMR_N/PF15905_5/0_018RasGAP_C/PF03836_15/0_073TolA_bind_tri/PF16331_5/1_4e02TolA_bind_tri/PF16331_5/0_15bZIP_1/PF00170_21/3_8e03bZIP_1/PF00170_21/0_048FtsL/PF04999_13/0_077UPF0449/PF15136_6/0_12APG6_